MAESKKDYYEVLELSKGADAEEIKKAYRRLAKKYHPDVNPGDQAAEARFKEINEAYEVLSDSEKKSRYDQFGHAGVDPAYGAGGGYGEAGFGGMGGFSDIFETFFGGFGGGAQNAQRHNAPRKGRDIHQQVMLSFEEAAFGCKREVNIQRVEKCAECSGSGAKKGTSAQSCPTCGGTGQQRVRRQTAFGFMQTVTTCSACGGTGKIIKEPCEKCRGQGFVRVNKKVEVAIPAGIDDGETMAVRDMGDEGINGGPPGDLLITVGIRPHPIFERRGTDVLCDFPVTFVQAALGAELEVPTIDGRVKYSIPPGTQTHTVFRLKGKGIPHIGGRGRGDQMVRVIVEVPTKLSAAQQKLLQEFDAMGGQYKHQKGFFDKIKDAFDK